MDLLQQYQTYDVTTSLKADSELSFIVGTVGIVAVSYSKVVSKIFMEISNN